MPAPSRLALLAVALLVPAALPAQQKAGARPVTQPAPAPSAAEMQKWVTEVQQLHGKLEALQARALEDPQLSTQQRALGEGIKTAMQKADPQLEALLGRGMELETQARAAQEKGDQARLAQLAAEMQQIQMRFVTAQQQVLQQPQLAAELKTFQTRLQQKMSQLDPQAPGMIARFSELQAKLAAAMRKE